MNLLMKIICGFLTLFICFVLFGYSVGPGNDVQAAIDATPNILRANLSDPDSLQIDSMTVYRAYDGGLHICGQLRAKNGFGGSRRALYVIAPGFPTPVWIGDKPNNATGACVGQIVHQTL